MGLLHVENITAGYGAGPNILNDVSLIIEAGKTYCIIGPNGAGKSTLLKTICGLLRPRSGTVMFREETISGLDPEQILAKGICYVPQYQSLFPDMTVRENLIMGGYIENDRRIVKKRIESIHELFPILNERSSQRAKTLSGGEQQLLALARAIMLRPKLLMLDEPSLGLAPKLVNQIFETVERFKIMGITMLLVEQNARRGLQCADWGFVLDLGTNRFEGPADSILSDPRIQELYLGRQRVNQKEEKP